MTIDRAVFANLIDLKEAADAAVADYAEALDSVAITTGIAAASIKKAVAAKLKGKLPMLAAETRQLSDLLEEFGAP